MFDFYYQVKGARRKTFHVQGDVCTIGSARNNDLVIDVKSIAKRHAELRLKPDGIYITDLGSMGGCWINGERVISLGPLSDIDEVSVGDVLVNLNLSSVDRSELNKDAKNDVSASENGLTSNAQENPSAAEEAKKKAPTKTRFLDRFGFKSNASNDRFGEAANAADNSKPTELENSVNTESAAQALNDESVVNLSEELDNASPHEAELTRHAEDEQSALEAQRKIDEEYAYWAAIVHEQLLHQMDLRRKDVNRMSDEELRIESTSIVESVLTSLTSQIPDYLDPNELQQNVLNEAIGLGPLQQFLDDESVTEIMVNNYQEIFVERNGKLEQSRFRFTSDKTVAAVIERIITPLGRRIDESSPIVDARLKDGSRVNAVIPPLALKGPSMTIRKFPKKRLQFSDLIQYGSTNDPIVEFLRVCVEKRKNIVVAGGTGSGKTTLLNVLSNFIPPEDRVVTIEDAAELKLVQPNLVSLESRPPNLEGKGAVPIRDLVKNSLRMRPDRIVVGECRGGEALDMLQAMNTGHDGSLTTIHANSPRDVISRLEVLVLMAGMELPVTAIREQVASAVDIIIQQTRYHCGSRKISKVTEVVGVESGTVQLQDIFIYDQSGVDDKGTVQGEFTATGNIPTFYEELRSIGIDVNLDAFAVSNGFQP